MNSLSPSKLCRCFAITLWLLPGRPPWPCPMRRRLSSHLSCLTRSPSVRIQIQRTGDPLSESTNISTTIQPPRPEEGETSKFGNGGHSRPVSLAVPFVAPDPSDRSSETEKKTTGRTKCNAKVLFSAARLVRFFDRSFFRSSPLPAIHPNSARKNSHLHLRHILRERG